MIDRITVRNFKSLHEVDLSLGRMNLFIGANSSGKSNLLEAFRVLQGVGRGLTIREVLDGTVGNNGALDWNGVRGGSAKVCSIGNLNPNQEVTIRARGTLEAHLSDRWDYSITFTPANGNIVLESLKLGRETVYSFENTDTPYIAHLADDEKLQNMTHINTGVRRNNDGLEVERPNLGSIPSHSEERPDAQVVHQQPYRGNSNAGSAVTVAQSLSNLQQVDPLPYLLREQVHTHHIHRMGDHCRGFITFIDTICRNEKTKDQFLSWMHEFSEPNGDQFAHALSSFGGTKPVSSKIGLGAELATLSDGTLRFAALVAAFFQTDMPEIMLIDEIETSIHAGRVRLLVELLGTQAGCQTTQVIATSHSPVVLEWLKDTQLANIFFCNRDYDTGESVIRPLLEVPHSEESLRNAHFFDVATERWLELMS